MKNQFTGHQVEPILAERRVLGGADDQIQLRLGAADAREAVFRTGNPTKHHWDAYAELAMTYKDSGDTTHAIQAASRLLDFAPLQIPTHNQLGYWYEEVGEKSKARQQFEIYRNLAQKNKSEPQTDRYQAALHELKKLSQ